MAYLSQQTRAAAPNVRILVSEFGVGHVDLNFGCPVPKVTRKGGGAALPYKRGLLEQILRSAVAAAEPAAVPVTMKTRIGIDHQDSYEALARFVERVAAADRLLPSLAR